MDAQETQDIEAAFLLRHWFDTSAALRLTTCITKFRTDAETRFRRSETKNGGYNIGDERGGDGDA